LAGLTSLAGLTGSMLVPPWAQSAPQGEDKAILPPQLGSLLPLPELTLLDGSRFHPADAEGQILVLDWRASWCPFCAQQSPWMDKFWLANKARGLRKATWTSTVSKPSQMA
jgi:thiol-disulfide isomerase/thioredoxin